MRNAKHEKLKEVVYGAPKTTLDIGFSCERQQEMHSVVTLAQKLPGPARRPRAIILQTHERHGPAHQDCYVLVRPMTEWVRRKIDEISNCMGVGCSRCSDCHLVSDESPL